MASSKRKFEEYANTAAPSSQRGESATASSWKHRRTASGSDFSTYDISHALDMPIAPAPPAPVRQPLKVSQGQPTADLLSLLDFSTLDSTEDIVDRMGVVASELLHNYQIEVSAGEEAKKTERLDILELEFYLYKSGVHEDPFTHASAEQSQAGQWYFHRPPRRADDAGTAAVGPAGYRGGTRKGLDLTIGRPPPALTSRYFSTPSIYGGASASGPSSILRGGILIRSIRRGSDSKVISGPSLLVDELLRLSGACEITELVALNWDGDISAFEPQLPRALPRNAHPRLSTMSLVRAPAPRLASASAARPRIFRSPRIGLDISHPSVPPGPPVAALAHPRVAYVARAYRFFTRPHLLTANGRGQTFVGVHDALRAAAYCEDDAALVQELVRLTALKGSTAAKYLAALRAGVRSGQLAEWVGPKGKTVLSSVTAWLGMVGTLRRLQVASGPQAAGASHG
ncbi:hypothetical protein BD413DRAFT_654809 [Trametes elegans]|nr:hypothetical protein BD413DRAFT_654809 [Trametes elegans]